ncbi:chromate transporter [Fictibacillus phosphorivorans]|uniref:chromate transporter n=1 Tax=Fictibacillus phosphorivorans TaxID=1221500 RepID=UPI00204187D0|nr:chromate transporter [Fictibacillus phosphorivorans]MCM3717602.1 chromate transporter [Fictibacillus phosphorivorans]MCM3775502.1 chromate transporter [Fictibacillus phosphorivorans]
MTYLNLFLAFFRSGMLGYGGGPSSIPLVHKEVVEKYKWMNDEEFGDVLALGNTLPGPIATKMAGYIGYRVAGFLGLTIALLATMLPTIFLMILLLTSLREFKDQSWVQGMTKGVIPVVAVMLAVLTWQFVQASKKSLGLKVSLLHLFAGVVLLQFLGMHPGIIIGLLLAYALFGPVKEKKDRNENAVRVREGEKTG